MYLLGSFVTQQFSDKTVLADLDFFPFPEMAMEGTDAVEAPIDGFMASKKGGDNQAAKDLLAFAGTAEGQEPRRGRQLEHRHLQRHRQVAFTPLNKKSAEVIVSEVH